MAGSVETTCPLCGTPRPRGANRCICNYTFEYERESSAFRRVSSRAIGRRTGPAGMGAVVLALAAAAAAGALFYMQTLELDRSQGQIGVLLVAVGVFAIAGGFFDWSFFMRNSRARRFVRLFGRSGARLVYGIVGGGLTGAGAALLLA